MTERERLAGLGVPEGIAAAILAPEFDEHRPAVAVALRFAERRDLLLVLAGPPRVGKSVASAVGAAACRSAGREAFCREPCNADTPGAFFEQANGCHYVLRPVSLGGAPLPGRWMHAPEASDNIFSEPFWTAATRAGVLVLDDLGLGPQPERVVSRLVGLLVSRYDAARPTIVTTNLAHGAFRQAYASGPGERLAARLGGGAWMQVVQGPPARRAAP
jgi:hypothetical protein